MPFCLYPSTYSTSSRGPIAKELRNEVFGISIRLLRPPSECSEVD